MIIRGIHKAHHAKKTIIIVPPKVNQNASMEIAIRIRMLLIKLAIDKNC